jgi:peptidoglycan hydrolase-like protein with peptidoglycan-binding domain
MGEFLHKNRQNSDRNQNLHQTNQTQNQGPEQKPVQKAEAEAEPESITESPILEVFQRKWDGDEGGEEKNKPRGPVPSMREEEEIPVQRYGPVPVQFQTDIEEEPIQRKGPVPIMSSDAEEPVQRYGPVPIQLQESTDEEPLQRKGPVPLMNHGEEVTQNDSPSLSGKMPSIVQRKMEASFGEDFSDVNIHKDSSQSKELNAHAHTQGNEIHFAPGMYNPESQKGQELLGHELTHVVQQREGRVQPTVQKKGVNINDDEGLEKEADEMGEKAAKGVETGTVQRATGDGVQLKALEADKVDAYFKDYEKFAQDQLDHWYSKTTVEDDKKLTGSMFSKAAKKVYDEKKDLSFVVPVEYALAQARLEGGLMGKERTEGNIFNVGAFDSGVTSTEQGINNKEKGFDAYYKLMSDSFLSNKTADTLLENGNFTTKSGGVYATNPFYEIEIKAEIGLMHYRDSEYALSGTVGKGKKNAAHDVEIVGGLLAQLGYITKDKATDTDAVCAAILEFQTKELAPEGEEWFKKRMDLVTNATDKENMNIKLKNNKDGIVGKEGTTIGLLYFKTILSSKIPDLKSSEDTKEESTAVEAVVNNASIVSATPSAEANATQAIPSDVKVGVKDGQPVGSKTEIIKVQKSLKALGYYHGTADGFITRKDGSESDTVKAIKKFQKDHQLSESGNIDAATDLEIVKAVAALPVAPAVTTPAKAATKTTSATTTKTNKPAVKPEAVPAKSAEQIYRLYGGEMLAIGKEMLAVSKSNPGLVIKMLDYLSWYEKDNLAYNLSSHLSESDLSSIDKKLVQRLYNELDSGYTSAAEQKQMDKLSKFLPKAEVAKEVVKETKKETKPKVQNSNLDLSGNVGKGGDNKAKDVLKIQNFLVNFNYLASSSEEIAAVKSSNTQNPDTKIEDKNLKDTIAAIKEYQKYGATTNASVASQDGKISKNKYTHTSMKEMNRIYNQYNDQKFEGAIANVLSDSQWRTQFRYGYNFKDGEDSLEKEYISFVKEKTGYDDPADLHKASDANINIVKDKFVGAKWFATNGVKENAIRKNQKAREAKPNFVCCWDTASLMLSFCGATEKGENAKIQTFVKDSQAGKFTNQAELGIKYIDAQLKNGKPVFVGIEKGKNRTINEGTTDHFILIVGKKKVGDKWFYNYFDPGTTSSESGYSENNKLFIGEDKKSVENGDFKLSQIRVNKE